jgi:hypothetical protein
MAGTGDPPRRDSAIAYALAGRSSARSSSLMKSTTGTGAERDVDAHASANVAHTTSGRRTRIACVAIAWILVLGFVGWIARFYHPGLGFTALIGFPTGSEYEAPALRQVPHYQYSGSGVYDGQFYAQRALDPLLRDPEVDHAMDLAPFRARRILFSWTAYAAGLGRPSWILEAYALQNVVAWLLLAVLLMRWAPPRTPRGLAIWTACLFSHGMLWSVRFALLDGPSALLTAVAVKLAEDGRAFASAVIVGINGLARETNVIGMLAQPLPRTARAWGRVLAAAVIAVLPLLIWEDYLRSIYRSTIFAGVEGQAGPPGLAFLGTVARTWARLRVNGVVSGTGLDACILLSVVAQAAYLLLRHRVGVTWWRVAIGYVLLMALLDRVLWDPATGALTRVMLPMTLGFNILLLREARPARFWGWFALGNVHLVPALWVL